VGTSVVDERWVVLRYAHDLKRARKDQSYQRGARAAKTSDTRPTLPAAVSASEPEPCSGVDERVQARLRVCWPVMVSTHRSTA
jgi:hypothetical protein